MGPRRTKDLAPKRSRKKQQEPLDSKESVPKLTISKSPVKQVNKEKNYSSKPAQQNRDFTPHGRPTAVVELINSLNTAQREAVKKIGFGGLLKLNLTKLSGYPMLRWLVQSFNPCSWQLSVGRGRSFVITPDDVHDIFMLPRNQGCDVLSYSRGEENVLLEKFSEYGLKANSKLSELAAVFKTHLKDGGEDFKRFFVFFCMSSLFTPSANHLVCSVSLFKSLVDVDSICKLDWCSFVFHKLCESVDAVRKNSSHNVTGCLLILQVAYLHRIRWHGIRLPRSIPLIQHWNNDNLHVRCKQESNNGLYGDGELCLDEYPVTINGLKRPVSVGAAKSFSGDAKDLQSLLENLMTDISETSNGYIIRLNEIKKKLPDSTSDSDSQFWADEKILQNVDELVENFMRAKNIADMPSYELFPDNPFSSRPSSDKSAEVEDDEFSCGSSDKEHDEEDLGDEDSGSEEEEDEEEGISGDGNDDEDDEGDEEDEEESDGKSKKAGQDVGEEESESDDDDGKEDDQGEKHESAGEGMDEDVVEGRTEGVLQGNEAEQVAEKEGEAKEGKKEAEQEVGKEGEAKEGEKEAGKDEEGDGDEAVFTAADEVNAKAIDEAVDNSFRDLIRGFSPDVGFVSNFVNTNLSLFSDLDRHEIELVDYIFQPGGNVIEEFYCNDDGMYLVNREDFLTMHSDTEIAHNVLNALCFSINCCQNQGSCSSSPSRFVFGLDYSVPLNRILRNDPDREAYEKEVMGGLEHFLDMTSEEVFMSAELIFMPFCIYGHYALVVVNLLSGKFQYLDNLVHVEKRTYNNCIRLLKMFIVRLMKKRNHPRVSDVNVFNIEDVKLKWKSKDVNKDCGLFLMHHILNFHGEVYDEPDLSNAGTRIFYRAKFCSIVAESQSNILREGVFQNVFAFYEKKALGAGTVKDSVAASERKRKADIVAYERRKILRPRVKKD